MNGAPPLAATVRAIERLLLPNVCVACGRAVEAAHPDALLCAVCRTRLRPVEPGCPRCRQPMPPVGPCRCCADWPAELRRVDSAVWLGDEARQVVHALKYQGYSALAGLAAEIIVERLPRPVGHLVPVPLSTRRRRERGYNQSAVLARNLASAWDLPLLDGVLFRTRDTGSQTVLKPSTRRRNVASAFSATTSPVGGFTAGAILIDDVLTTGATLVAAAKALGAAGWTDIAAVTFARARTFAVRAGGG